MTRAEALLWEVLSKDEPYFIDDNNGPGDWYCVLGCTSVPAVWGGHPVMPQCPNPFPHTPECTFTQVRALLHEEYGFPKEVPDEHQ